RPGACGERGNGGDGSRAEEKRAAGSSGGGGGDALDAEMRIRDGRLRISGRGGDGSGGPPQQADLRGAAAGASGKVVAQLKDVGIVRFEVEIAAGIYRMQIARDDDAGH